MNDSAEVIEDTSPHQDFVVEVRHGFAGFIGLVWDEDGNELAVGNYQSDALTAIMDVFAINYAKS